MTAAETQNRLSAVWHVCLFCGVLAVLLVGLMLVVPAFRGVFAPSHEAIYRSFQRDETLTIRRDLFAHPEMLHFKSIRSGNTLMHLAAQAGKPRITRLLLEKKVSLTAKNAHGDMPIVLAIRHDHADVVRAMLDHGFAVDKPCNKNGENPLQLAAFYAAPESTAILIRYGAQVNSGNATEQEMPLQCALKSFPITIKPTPQLIDRYTRTVSLLLDHGAKVDVQDSGGQTPLNLAVATGQCSIVKALLDHGAASAINHKPRHGITPLATAKIVANITQKHDLVQLLQSYGAKQ